MRATFASSATSPNSAPPSGSNSPGYMYLGELIEFGDTEKIFIKPVRKETEDYITGRFG